VVEARREASCIKEISFFVILFMPKAERRFGSR
jgi:hypothetical protein